MGKAVLTITDGEPGSNSIRFKLDTTDVPINSPDDLEKVTSPAELAGVHLLDFISGVCGSPVQFVDDEANQPPVSQSVLMERCEAVLRWYGVEDRLVEYGDGMHSLRHSDGEFSEPFAVYSITVFADDPLNPGERLLSDITINSRSVDGLVHALDATLRAHLWLPKGKD